MRQTLLKIALGCGVAALSAIADGVLIAAVDPEHVLENFQAFLMLIALLGIKGAFMYFKQHEKELTDAIDPKRFTPILIMAASLSLAACASAAAPVQTTPPPATVVIRAELVKAIDWADTALHLAKTIQQVEIEAYSHQRVTDAQHRRIQTAFVAFATAAERSLLVARDLTQSPVTRWAAAQAIGGLAADLVAHIEPHLPAEVRRYLTALRATLDLLATVGAQP